MHTEKFVTNEQLFEWDIGKNLSSIEKHGVSYMKDYEVP